MAKMPVSTTAAPKKMKKKELRNLLLEENEFISNLLMMCEVPNVVFDEADNEVIKDKPGGVMKKFPILKPPAKPQETSDKIMEEIMANKMKNKKNKLSDRGIKKKEKKKLRKEKKNKVTLVSVAKSFKNEIIKQEKMDEDSKAEIQKKIKPVFNQEGKMVFSKFDFAAGPNNKGKNKNKGVRNATEALKKIKKTDQEIKTLMASGDKEKALELKSQNQWKKAFDKIEGKKIKDNPEMLKKSIHKKEIQKKKSKHEWKERGKKLEQKQDMKAKKRQENINKKIDMKKKHKMQKLGKRGRIVPGF